MKILMVLMGLDIGGVETHVMELSKSLYKMGHEVIVISNGGVYQNELKNAGVIHIHAPLMSRKPQNLIKSYWVIDRAIRQYKPDIVHAHARIPAFLCGLINKTMKFHFVTTVHYPFEVSLKFRILSNWGDRALAVSQDLKTYLIENYDYPAEKIGVTVNGIDVEKFRTDISCRNFLHEKGLLRDVPRIVCVSRLNDDVCTHIFNLLEIFISLQDEISGLEVVVVGDGSKFAKICEIANGINVRLGRRAVIMTGARTDIANILASATICIGVSRAILEPMAMEKPVILAGAAGYIGIFDQDKLDLSIACNFTCRRCKPVNNVDLKDDILTLFRLSNEQRSNLGKYCRSVISEYYSIKKMTNDNLNLYKEALRSGIYDVCLLGYYGFKNSGDDALLYAIVDSLREISNDIRITVLSNNPAETKEKYKVDAIGRINFFKIYKTIKKSKVFIEGGGSLIQDVTSTKSLIYYLFILRLAKMAGAKTMLYANGIGPIKLAKNKRRVRRSLNKVDVITLRDEESSLELEKLGVTQVPIVVTADPAFSLKKCNDLEAKEILRELQLNEDDKFVCISARKWKNSPEDLVQMVASLADYIAEKYDVIPLFLSMQYPYDASISRQIIAAMKQRGVFIDKRLDIDTTFGILKQAECVVGIRLHTLIFASVLKIPALGIAYDPKVIGFQKDLGQQYFLDPLALAAGDFKNIVDGFMQNKEKIKSELEIRVEELREKEKINPEIVIRMISDEW